MIHWVTASAFERRCDEAADVLDEARENLRKVKKRAVFKLFYNNCNDWCRSARAIDLLKLRGACYVVLERNVLDRECSLDWAEQSGDWAGTPQNHERWLERSALRERPPCNKTTASPDFNKAHEDWFHLVRTTLRDERQPSLELSAETFMDPTLEGHLPIEEVANNIIQAFPPTN